MIRSISRALLTLLFTYIIAIGATFNGVISPDFKPLTLALLAVVAGLWLIVRWRRGWRWHHTPLDAVMLLWALAFVVALLANQDVWRRSLMAFWYMAVYIGTWYILQDVLANGGVSRAALIDASLITGLIVMLFGYLQVYGWVKTQLPLILNNRAAFDLPRPVSTLGNTNALGTFMIVLTAFALGRLVVVKNTPGRIIMGIYSGLAILLAVLTYSRGTWLGLGAALGVFGCLLLMHHNLLSITRLREGWSGLAPRYRRWLSALAALGAIALVVMVVLFINTFSQPGRTLERRTVLYQPALDLFLEKPLTGYGLFTFGRGYARLVSLPPNQPHSHAHNAALHIGAELGMVGLAALFATLGALPLALRRNWRAAADRERLVLASTVAAVAGFGVHHLLDTPAMMPAIALTGLLALSLALVPCSPQRVENRWRRWGSIGFLTALWIAVLITGAWSSGLYRQYIDILQEGLRTRNYAQAAQRLQPIIDADPSLALYSWEQGYLYGLAAENGDSEMARRGITAYQRSLALEAYHAVSWANIAALYWQVGDTSHAVQAMQRAADLAPSAWALRFNLGVYLEQSGDLENAEAAYARALNSLSYLYPAWEETDLRQHIADQFASDGLGKAVLLLEQKDADGALAAWDQASVEDTPRYAVLRLLIALAQGDQESAEQWLTRAHEAVVPGNAEHAAWLRLAQARIFLAAGDTISAEREWASAQELLAPALLEEDYVYGSNVAHFQFLRAAINRQFLPQVYYPTADMLLVRLLAMHKQLQG